MEEAIESTLAFAFAARHFFEIIGLIIAYLSFSVPVKQYLDQKRLDERDKRFKNFYLLIKELVSPEGEVMIDRQVAVVFELRKYPAYFEVTRRILEGLRQTWPSSYTKLFNEINLAINFVDQS